MRFLRFVVFRLIVANHFFQLLQKSGAAARKLDFVQVADAVDHTFCDRSFQGEHLQHAVFDGVFADQVDRGDRARLVLAPGTGDTLF